MERANSVAKSYTESMRLTMILDLPTEHSWAVKATLNGQNNVFQRKQASYCWKQETTAMKVMKILNVSVIMATMSEWKSDVDKEYDDVEIFGYYEYENYRQLIL